MSTYDDADSRLTAIISAIPTSAWTDPSPCDGWTTRDVLQHLITTQRDFLVNRGVNLGTAPDVVADPVLAWRQHADGVVSQLSDEAVAERAFEGFFGPTTVADTIDRFYVWDMLVHRWDIATAVGQDAALSGEELDRIDEGASGFGEALHMEGICGPAVEPPAGADRLSVVLGRLGRTA